MPDEDFQAAMPVDPGQPAVSGDAAFRQLGDTPPEMEAQRVTQAHVNTQASWDETAAELRRKGLDPEKLRSSYELGRAKQFYQGRYGSKETMLGGAMEQLGRHGIPLGSLLDVRNDKGYAKAKQAFDEGRATKSDIDAIARYERLQGVDEEGQKTTIGGMVHAGLKAPQIVGEMAMGGTLLKVAAKAAPTTGFGRLLAGTGVAKNPALSLGNPAFRHAITSHAGRMAVLTPLAPSMYLEDARQRNMAAGREPDAWEGFGPALLHGYANMLVLGSLQKHMGGQTFLGQVGRKAAVGVGEQQLVDAATGTADKFLSKNWQIGTKFGVVGDLLDGKVGDAMHHATVQAFTFGLFAAMHGKTQPRRGPGLPTAEEMPDTAKAEEAMANYADLVNVFQSKHLTPDATARAIHAIHTAISKAHDRPTGLGHQEAIRWIEGIKDVRVRDAARKYVDSLKVYDETIPEQVDLWVQEARQNAYLGAKKRGLSNLSADIAADRAEGGLEPRVLAARRIIQSREDAQLYDDIFAGVSKDARFTSTEGRHLETQRVMEQMKAGTFGKEMPGKVAGKERGVVPERTADQTGAMPSKVEGSERTDPSKGLLPGQGEGETGRANVLPMPEGIEIPNPLSGQGRHVVPQGKGFDMPNPLTGKDRTVVPARDAEGHEIPQPVKGKGVAKPGGKPPAATPAATTPAAPPAGKASPPSTIPRQWIDTWSKAVKNWIADGKDPVAPLVAQGLKESDARALVNAITGKVEATPESPTTPATGSTPPVGKTPGKGEIEAQPSSLEPDIAALAKEQGVNHAFVAEPGERLMFHTASYKEPSKSVDSAIEEMLVPKVIRPVRVWVENKRADTNADKGTVTFVVDSSMHEANGGKIEPVGDPGQAFAWWKTPFSHDPALKRVIYKGKEGDKNWKKLADAVERANQDRAELGIDSKIELVSTQGKPMSRIGRKRAEAQATWDALTPELKTEIVKDQGIMEELKSLGVNLGEFAPREIAPVAPTPTAPPAAKPAAKKKAGTKDDRVKRSADFKESGMYDVTTAQGVKKIYRDPHTRMWNEDSPSQGKEAFEVTYIGDTKEAAVAAIIEKYKEAPAAAPAAPLPPKEVGDYPAEGFKTKEEGQKFWDDLSKEGRRGLSNEQIAALKELGVKTKLGRKTKVYEPLPPKTDMWSLMEQSSLTPREKFLVAEIGFKGKEYMVVNVAAAQARLGNAVSKTQIQNDFEAALRKLAARYVEWKGIEDLPSMLAAVRKGGGIKQVSDDAARSEELGGEARGGKLQAPPMEVLEPEAITKPEEKGKKKEPPTHMQIIATMDALFGYKDYTERKTITGAVAEYDPASEAGITAKMGAQHLGAAIHERAHHLAVQHKLNVDPNSLPQEVIRGLWEFDYDPVRRSQMPTPRGLMEGMAEWLRLRTDGSLNPANLTPEQRAAAEYLEGWARQNKLTEGLDRIRDMFRDLKGASAEQQARALTSGSAQPAQPVQTIGERAESVGDTLRQQFDETIVNDLQKASEMDALQEKKLGRKLKPSESVYTTLSQMMNANKAFAAEFEQKGVFTIINGQRVTIGQGMDAIIGGAKPEWITPGKNGEASRAGTYAVARHLVGERARGYEQLQEAMAQRSIATTKEEADAAKEKELFAKKRINMVPEYEFDIYKRALDEARTDEAFYKWAEPFAERLTTAFLATRVALESPDIHLLKHGTAAALHQKRPDYVPTDRVISNKNWRTPMTPGQGERIGEIMHARSGGSAEPIVDPLVSLHRRYRVTAAYMTEQIRRTAIHEALTRLNEMGGGRYAIPANKMELTKEGRAHRKSLKDEGFDNEEIAALMSDPLNSEYFAEKPWPVDGTKPTWWYIGPDAKPYAWRVGDRALYNLITGQQVEGNQAARVINAIANVEILGGRPLKFAADMLRLGATTVNIMFHGRNVPRDIYSFYSNTTDRAAHSPGKLLDAYKAAYAYEYGLLRESLGGPKAKPEGMQRLMKLYHDYRGEYQKMLSFDPQDPLTAYRKAQRELAPPVIRNARSVWDVMKQTVRLLGAGENAPRFLEFTTQLKKNTGLDVPELIKRLEEADKAHAEGKRFVEPFEMNAVLDAMNRAAEVTVPFQRQGSVTRQINRVVPYFGPAISGTSKAFRNLRDNPKNALQALGFIMGLRLAHWAMFSDEDWWPELSANDRMNNFVMPIGDHLYRLPGPRNLEVPIGGFLTTVLDAAADKNPDVRGWVKESLESNLPPAPIPPPIRVGLQLQSNEDWMGKPIVPRRELDASSQRKLMEYQLPYAARQLTGGRGEISLRGAGVALPVVKNARRSVDEFYDRFREIEAAENDRAAEDKQKGKKHRQSEQYKRWLDVEQKIRELTIKARVDGVSEERRAELVKRQIELARRTLGR